MKIKGRNIRSNLTKRRELIFNRILKKKTKTIKKQKLKCAELNFNSNLKIRKKYKGEKIYGEIKKGSLYVKGKYFDSPGSEENGWTF